MKRTPMALASWMLGWVVLLACVGSSAPHPFNSTRHGGEVSEPLAGRPRFPRGPSTPSTPKGPRAPESAPAAPKQDPKNSSQAQTPAQAQPPRKLTPVQAAMTRWLDPKVARQRFDQGLAEAKQKFPHLEGKPPQEHHVHPKYLGGPQGGPTVKVDPAYHQLITNEFRREHAYNSKLPDLEVQEEIMKKVYSKYPLPGVHF